MGPILTLLKGVSFVLALAVQSNLENLTRGLTSVAYKPFDMLDRAYPFPFFNDRLMLMAAGLWNFYLDAA
ncbi:hypothetical protein [Zarconia navalis]|uniref:hypothetical protein n=1 Tax=Zarconia navalis TaxID=2992134 RepID=UPI0021F898E7|nr:hypothetical protein [Zarconia navalis]